MLERDRTLLATISDSWTHAQVPDNSPPTTQPQKVIGGGFAILVPGHLLPPHVSQLGQAPAHGKTKPQVGSAEVPRRGQKPYILAPHPDNVPPALAPLLPKRSSVGEQAAMGG